MAIPDDATLQNELLAFLASEPKACASVHHTYEQLALLHPELTAEEKTERYRNSANKWANRVQFARLHLANKGLIYRANSAPNAPHGYWVLTPKGLERAAAATKNNSNQLELQVQADLIDDANEEARLEGSFTPRLVAHYERDPKLRVAAIQIHGTTCKACGFNFGAIHGKHGEHYIEVHHLVPVSTLFEPSFINPKSDLTVLCANCHRMVHRKKDTPLSITNLMLLVRSKSAAVQNVPSQETTSK